MRIHHLSCGTMCPPFAKLVNGTGGFFARGKMVCHCLLVETRDGLALIDTGLGTREVADPKRLGGGFLFITKPLLLESETALAQVKALGFKREDVRHVLPTHLNLDHASGLADFPEANVHIYALEHDAAMARATLNEHERYKPVQWAHGPKWQSYAQAQTVSGERWFGFEAVRAVGNTDDEILIVPLLGHTRGHCGIAVKTERGWLLHAGDAYFAHSEVHEPKWRCPPGLAMFQNALQIDGPARIANQKRLRELVRDHASEVQVICAHDVSELESAQRTTQRP